jgi:hypothetical protein
VNAAAFAQGVSPTVQHREAGAFEPQGNGDSATAGRRGAQHTLARLEAEEQESFCRLQRALQPEIDLRLMRAKPIG